MHEKYEQVFEVNTKYYEETVNFVQIVTLKSKVKTNIKGSIEFMACNNEQCMPPKKESFSIVLE